MPELTFKSAGISVREIDLSQPTPTTPTGVPAGIIGTSNEGPAFVPVTVANFSEFISRFGSTDGEKFGPLAVNEWLKNASSATYIRVLGAGDGKRRNTSTGKVTNAGFVAGAQQVQATGIVAANPFANTGGDTGNTYFLGCYMSQSSNSSVFIDAGNIDHKPIVRGVLMAPDGVILRLSSSSPTGSNLMNAPGSTVIGKEGNTLMRGAVTGSVDLANGNFVMMLNGHKGTAENPRVITASFDVNSPMYLPNVFNTDPFSIQEAGHYLYSHYDIHSSQAVATGSGFIVQNYPGPHRINLGEGDHVLEPIAFLTTGALAGGSSTVPDYRSFEDRFATAKSPYVISQEFGGSPYNLFKVESLSDGSASNTRFKISIENIAKSNSDANQFGKFDLVVRDFYDNDSEKVVLEQFRGLSLDRDSDRYFARVIGDQKIYFDFDQKSTAQKMVVDGDFKNQSRYIRVNVSSEVVAGSVPDNALPLGFRGHFHLVTSGTAPLTTVLDGSGGGGPNTLAADMASNVLKRSIVPPVPFRDNLNIGLDPKKVVQPSLYWGCQFTRKVDLDQPNKPDLFERSFEGYAKYFPTFAVSNLNVSVGDNEGKADTSANPLLDADRFNNNKFTLENIKVRTGSDTYADPKEWVTASYVRNGDISANPGLKTRAFSVNDLGVVGNRKYAKFTFFLQGGFDGTNIFNKDKSNLLDNAAKREMDDSSNQGGKDGPTVASYRKAIDIIGSKTDAEIKLLAIPGMRDESISDYAIDAVESRFDSMYIMDIEEYDTVNKIVTSSIQDVGVSNTVTKFKNRALDTSFAAAYFPDVVVQDPTTLTNVKVPPSVAVLGAFSLNDTLGHPWFAPAGFSRGSLTSVIQASVDLNRANLDEIYDADINPLTDFPGTGVVVWGQKTLLAAASALDRVNVRRLLIDIRRKVRAIANTLLFEPNRESTLEKFSGLVNPILQKIQEQSGLDRYKVIIDTTTTTQADIENNTIRGKIFVQPTRTAEFVALDFVVTNAGAIV